jgi:hypothetical protein
MPDGNQFGELIGSSGSSQADGHGCGKRASVRELFHAVPADVWLGSAMIQTMVLQSSRWVFVVTWASLAMMGVAAAQTLTLPGRATLQVGQRGAATTVTLRYQERILRASLPPDDSIFAHTLETSELIGAASGAFAVISSDYDSNPAGGSYQCGAGTETMIRVIALRPAPHQTFSQLVESCWADVDAGDIDWDEARQRLTIERTAVGSSGSDGGTNSQDDAASHTLTIYQVAADGAVTMVSVKQLP